MKTTQDAFHPMLGHMADGCEIAMRDGTVLVLKAVMRGWQLHRKSGQSLGEPTTSAHAIASLVASYGVETV